MDMRLGRRGYNMAVKSNFQYKKKVSIKYGYIDMKWIKNILIVLDNVINNFLIYHPEGDQNLKKNPIRIRGLEFTDIRSSRRWFITVEDRAYNRH